MSNLREQLQELKNQNNLYTKEHKTFQEQLEKLYEKKFIISNEQYTLSKLEHINYYRISAYFLPNTTFEDIIKLYYFDTELRKIIFESIEVIEIYLRTQIAYYHSQIIAKMGNINKVVFFKLFKALSSVRNACAHHSRLWNKTLGVSFEIPRNKPIFAPLINSKKKVFFALSVIKYILTCIGDDEMDFKNKIKTLLQKYENVDMEAMGFIKEWEDLEIWRSF
ncbi:MAG: Abi family protein [Sulfurimonas sp.]|uniref:Abi family protein n=1 Tax=Sulfurimonas sp. TaxID=2022749 RepID=UPI0025D11F17|nr:Abi family protein [Sulfurimonas sp.]MCK9492325.1 Abi family protein [Sulfurimonas sp.]